ncbi:MAG: peptidase domain-containing ABC transporter [Bacteroidia bacterium]|nr:peptidase domain-containing ABC transporter [Bacteroidia bacterium]
MKSFQAYRQLDAMDCGPACLRMISKFYGKNIDLSKVRKLCYMSREGVSMMGISHAAEHTGFRTLGVRLTFEQLLKDAKLPCIAHWNQNHFVVIYKISKEKVWVADPAHDKIVYKKEEFLKGWISTKKEGVPQGFCLLIEPGPDFYTTDILEEKQDKSGFRFLFNYLRSYRSYITQLILGMIIGSIIQLLFPFLTQSIVDYGINNRDISFIYLVLIAQLVLFASRMSADLIKSWILLHIGSRVNISLISDFLIKMMKLPISFFDTKMIGDISQRIGDHKRIETFLTSSALNIVFSALNLVIFGIVLAIYNTMIFVVFLAGSIFYIIWIQLFLKKRRDLDSKRFAQLSNNQNSIFQIISGMQEIKLNNCEKQKRWDWESIQARIYRINLKSLSLNQYQRAGGIFINETKNIIITFLAAKAVLSGGITLGMMLAIQYIIGQLNSPVEQILNFLNETQDAKISLERLGEIHLKNDEEDTETEKISILPEDGKIIVSDLSFQYEGPYSELVLKDINMTFPEKKVTAIVGTSGSGKTTLIKLLLGFYPPVKGEIRVGDIQLKNINQRLWRQKCGVVMQDGFIFSDSIARNIALGEESIEIERLRYAVKIANIQDFIESLPMAYDTRIGADGHGLSQGQKQRILIARAVYKNPDYLFFDEATNALDAENEKMIIENLTTFYQGKTVVIVAHRLSTVIHSDQIVVLKEGRICESGNHESLKQLKGEYFNLIRNQLELGS